MPSVLRNGFSFDDREAILENPVVRGELPLSAVFDRDYWHHRGDAGHYRPLATLTLRFNYALFEDAAVGYHATNVLLHLAVVLLLILIAARRLPESVPWFGIAFFAAHPALADSVAWISGRTSSVSALGGLLGALWLVRARSSPLRFAAALFGVFLALLGKEDGVIFAVAYFVLAPRSGRSPVVVGSVLGILSYVSLRAAALGSAIPAAIGAPLGDTGFAERAHFAAFSLLEVLRLSVLPYAISPHYRVEDIAPPVSATSVLAAVVVLAAIVALVLSLRNAERRIPARLSAALALVAFLPVAQLVPAGEVFAPRFLYPVLLFAAPLVHVLLVRVSSFSGGALARGAGLCLWVGLAWVASATYESRASYRTAILTRHPEDSRSWNGLGHAHFEAGDYDAAREAFRESTRLDPNYSRPHTNLGIVDWTQGRRESATAHFETAVRVGRENPVAHIWLGRARLETERFDEAALLFERATKLSPGTAAAWRGLAEARLGSGDHDSARRAAERARELAPRDAATQNLLQRLGTKRE